jgi:hypothetical protein
MHFSGCNSRPTISRSFYQALLQNEDELLQTSPKDSLLLMVRFTALGEIDGIPNAKLAPAANMLLSALPQDPVLRTSPPLNFQIARVFVRRNINPEQVPELVAAALRLEPENEWRSDCSPAPGVQWCVCVSSQWPLCLSPVFRASALDRTIQNLTARTTSRDAHQGV